MIMVIERNGMGVLSLAPCKGQPPVGPYVRKDGELFRVYRMRKDGFTVPLGAYKTLNAALFAADRG
jgi:hypothetical protein